MKRALNATLCLSACLLTAQAMAQVTFYEREGFRGRTFAANGTVENFQRTGFNDKASSVIVDNGRWEVCQDAHFDGRCVVLRPGSYDSLARMGMNDRISSVRPVSADGRYDNDAPEPLPQPTYEYRRRPDERLTEVPVTSVRAVVGPPEERCWVERQQVTEESRGKANVGGAIAGALIGGILGHQIGGGRGQDIATAGGAVAGAAVGANAGRSRGEQTYDRDVRRCEKVASGPPEYWDVTYNYRGVQHRVQMSSPPGRTVLVNRDGEPRG
ncbi:beta/gamma crystallin-related protein [Chitinimonas naiadis]